MFCDIFFGSFFSYNKCHRCDWNCEMCVAANKIPNLDFVRKKFAKTRSRNVFFLSFMSTFCKFVIFKVGGRFAGGGFRLHYFPCFFLFSVLVFSWRLLFVFSLNFLSNLGSFLFVLLSHAVFFLSSLKSWLTFMQIIFGVGSEHKIAQNNGEGRGGQIL